MDIDELTLRGVARGTGHLLVGTVGTTAAVVALLWLVEPARPVVFDAFYLAVGPWTAEMTATLLSFTLAGIVAVSLPTLGAVYWRSRAEHVPTLLAGLAGALGLVAVGLSLAALAGAVTILDTLLAFAAFAVAVPLGLRATGAWPSGAVTFAGGLPVLALLVLLLGVGLGWGGGYDVVATEVPAADVEGGADATFADAPRLRDDLLASSGDGGGRYSSGDDVRGYCAENAEGRRACRLSLRGYEHEAAAARFLDDHGARCPYRLASPGRPASGNRSFVAADGGTYYRVTCQSYGD